MERGFIVVMLLVGGCAVPTAPPEVAVDTGSYAPAFDAAKRTLTSYRFELERVDARAGVITTRPKLTAGLATPWDLEQSTLTSEWEDFVNEQRRTVRITFAPSPPDAAPAKADVDLRDRPQPVTATVEVTLERVQHTGRRLEPTAIQLSSITLDPQHRARGLWPTYAVAFSQDPLLARRIAEDIRRATPRPAPSPGTPPATP
jgi:hypothetical protein